MIVSFFGLSEETLSNEAVDAKERSQRRYEKERRSLMTHRKEIGMSGMAPR